MIVYLLRHGKAAQSSPDGPRVLTDKGRAEVAAVAAHFKKKGLKFSRLWHSSKTRAIQTAEIFLVITGQLGVVLEEKKELKPEGDSEEVFEEINELSDGALVIVSHMPFVASLGQLLSGEGGADMDFPTAGLAAFERKGGAWKFLWTLDPANL